MNALSTFHIHSLGKQGLEGEDEGKQEEKKDN